MLFFYYLFHFLRNSGDVQDWTVSFTWRFKILCLCYETGVWVLGPQWVGYGGLLCSQIFSWDRCLQSSEGKRNCRKSKSQIWGRRNGIYFWKRETGKNKVDYLACITEGWSKVSDLFFGIFLRSRGVVSWPDSTPSSHCWWWSSPPPPSSSQHRRRCRLGKLYTYVLGLQKVTRLTWTRPKFVEVN